ncbi:uncharacterized protein F5147DRAFT_692956 [Suillus discolor]|uniref:Uncharacterized protein n=1 Tax=Suillus discolor TaxID=1912936 RepID=A0A9P7F8Y3_9AGAM|nr:uncharacterized protein F5147DRAFT_692956 [Suillus discolor]KAG2109348.1 hypothetical protein F5147DRAFT_692956 [Suillus discolor]
MRSEIILVASTYHILFFTFNPSDAHGGSCSVLAKGHHQIRRAADIDGWRKHMYKIVLIVLSLNRYQTNDRTVQIAPPEI